MATVPQQFPNLIDRAFRVAMATHSPTCIIVPSDVQELEYAPPTHAFKMVPSSVGTDWPTPVADDGVIAKAAEILNAGEKIAILVGQGARGARSEVLEVADLLGAGVAKALLGKDVLSDELPFVTGSIGLLGTRPSYEMMMDCDTVLTVGSNFPYTQFMPKFDQARGIQIDRDGSFIGMRYPYELNIVADAGRRAPGTHPQARAQNGTDMAEDDREERVRLVGHHATSSHDGQQPPRGSEPAATGMGTQRAASAERNGGGRLRVLGKLVRPRPALPR